MMNNAAVRTDVLGDVVRFSNKQANKDHKTQLNAKHPLFMMNSTTPSTRMGHSPSNAYVGSAAAKNYESYRVRVGLPPEITSWWQK